jgi:ATP-dependent Clp endopeptidase proteolytic subunit ClpP
MTLVLPDREPTKDEVSLIKATTKLREQELETAKIMTRAAQSAATKAEIELRDAQIEDQFNAAANFRNRTLGFSAPILHETVEQAIDVVSRWHRMEQGKPITVRFTSPGGEAIFGLTLFDALRAIQDEGTPIITVALGQAASMAAVLLQAGSERVVGPNSWFLIHEGSGALKGKMRDMEEQSAFHKRLGKNMMSILAERSTMTAAEIGRKAKLAEWWLNADECIKFGFADRIGYR